MASFLKLNREIRARRKVFVGECKPNGLMKELGVTKGQSQYKIVHRVLTDAGKALRDKIVKLSRSKAEKSRLKAIELEEIFIKSPYKYTKLIRT